MDIIAKERCGAVGALGDELGWLRRGRGVMAAGLTDRVGPTLCRMAGIEPGGHADDTGLPRGMVDDFADSEALVQPDAVGDIHLRYEHLKLGLVYGARWSAPD